MSLRELSAEELILVSGGDGGDYSGGNDVETSASDGSYGVAYDASADVSYQASAFSVLVDLGKAVAAGVISSAIWDGIKAGYANGPYGPTGYETNPDASQGYSVAPSDMQTYDNSFEGGGGGAP